MCEKNFEGKVLSPPSDGDIDESYPKDWEEVKPKKKKKRSSKKKKTKFCKTCGQDILENEMRNMLMFQDTYHQLQAKEYCKDHEFKHSDHKCKPHWCGDCRYLTNYEIEIQKGK
jgi:hypothetical protein